MFLALKQAADLAGVEPRQILARIQIGELNPAKCGTSVTTREVTFYFYEADMVRLKTLTWGPRKRNEKFVNVDEQTDLTVKQIATTWQLSTDTVQRLFQDEPGVIALGNKNPRGKRKRITLRIPRAVMERVKKTRSNSR
jgi:hypothetical protein